VRAGGSNNISQSEVGWAISQAGQPEGLPDLKKPTAINIIIFIINFVNFF
jgi:hypothetical protein